MWERGRHGKQFSGASMGADNLILCGDDEGGKEGGREAEKEARECGAPRWEGRSRGKGKGKRFLVLDRRKEVEERKKRVRKKRERERESKVKKKSGILEGKVKGRKKKWVGMKEE